MKKIDHVAVYECPSRLDRVFIGNFLRKKTPVWVLEPFYAYHHRKGIRFFPRPLPAYVERLIAQGRISLIKVKDIGADDIYRQSADKAVEAIESVYPCYKRVFKKLISSLVETLKSPLAENICKKNFCDRLAEFYSQNILQDRLSAHFPGMKILFFPDVNLRRYLFYKKLVAESAQEYYENPDIIFTALSSAYGVVDDAKKSAKAIALIFAQTVASAVAGWGRRARTKRSFSYGVTISGLRQLRGDERGPDFIIDNASICSSEVAYFPIIDIKKEQIESLGRLHGETIKVPRPGRFFSNRRDWLRLLILSLAQRPLRNGDELVEASVAFFQFFVWQRIMEEVKIRHFITHGDFGYSHIARNIALAHAGVQTYYFTDSMNFVNNFVSNGSFEGARHPFWSYLFYDHFVTWDDFLAEYFNAHPGTFKENHVVGCLWSAHIQSKDAALNRLSRQVRDRLKDKFVMTAFDSTYSKNGMTSYVEGVRFAADILEVIEEEPDMYLLLKEKKARSVHATLDPENGPRLIDVYERMAAHPRITICSNQMDASLLMSVADIVVSFPFTSTTFEALSANRPAIWHDPMGLYTWTKYAEAGGVTTHSLEGLKAVVARMKCIWRGGFEDYQNPLPEGSPLLDPYRDGKAINRFREILRAG